MGSKMRILCPKRNCGKMGYVYYDEQRKRVRVGHNFKPIGWNSKWRTKWHDFKLVESTDVQNIIKKLEDLGIKKAYDLVDLIKQAQTNLQNLTNITDPNGFVLANRIYYVMRSFKANVEHFKHELRVCPYCKKDVTVKVHYKAPTYARFTRIDLEGVGENHPQRRIAGGPYQTI